MSSDTYQLTLKFSDGVEYNVAADVGTSILEAALAADVAILNQCQSGSCGSCVGKLTAGEANMRSDVAASLLASEREEGLRLTCVCDAASDCTIEFDYESKAGLVRPEKVSAFVDTVAWLADDVVKLELELAEGDWMDFKPGQFVQLTVPGTSAERRYSIASTPQELPRLELLVRVLPEGVMSDYLRERAKVDDVIEMKGPYGAFFWRENMRAPHLFIAGGTGLAPMMSMLDVIRQSNSKKPALMLSFGCRNASSLFHEEPLSLRAMWMPTLEHRISVDEGPAPSDVQLGNPVEAVQAADVSSETVAYLCGPPQMVESAYQHLEGLGVKPENIYAEQFVASE